MWKFLGAVSGASLVGIWWLLVLEHPVLQQGATAAADEPVPGDLTAGPRPAGRELEGPDLRPAASNLQLTPATPRLQAPVEPANAPPALIPATLANPLPVPTDLESASPPAGPGLDAEPAPVATMEASAPPEPSWHPLWAPFRSQASAKGFADHLSRLSGRRLDVEQRGPGQYQVRLAYLDAADLQLGLTRIGEVSGLLPEAPP